MGAMPFEERAIARATEFQVTPAINITTCSANDLIVHKAFAARDHDWSDIRGILTRSSNLVSLDRILDELRPLAELKEEPEIITRLIQLFEQTT